MTTDKLQTTNFVVHGIYSVVSTMLVLALSEH